MNSLLRIVNSVIVGILLLGLSLEIASAKVLTFEKSGYQYTTDTTMVRFVNSNGIFDGTTEYVEVLSSAKNEKGGITGTVYHLVNLKKEDIKIHKVHLKKTTATKHKKEMEKINTDWTHVKNNKNSFNDELYTEVVSYINQNRRAVYERSAQQENSIEVSSLPPSTDTTIAEQVKEEKAPPNRSWTGTWGTSAGEMQLQQTGDKIECLIGSQKLLATIINDKAVGQWSGIKFFSSTESSGEFQLIMSPDGTFIKIKWRDKWTNWATDSTANRLP